MEKLNTKVKSKPKRVGIVVSDKMNKTAVVEVVRQYRHPLYGKIVRKSKKYKVHDEKNDANLGDTVQIEEHIPVSKTKRWKLSKIVERKK
ncbi:MAG: 30S ribosomal protein S17 [Candidatus Cloacimonetes bacterium]|nr:30S ribosomal protein S17 [Candidatus Cloacimonadota bacterium]MBS3766923.1 30S ribosomal protein S17 [Candidatus Cloacimonadota bacterium]